MDVVGESTNRACDCVGGVMANDHSARPIFLVGDAHCCLCGTEKCGQRCTIGDDGVCVVVEGDVAHTELLGVAVVIVAMAGVFAYTEEVIEGNGASIACGL